MAKKEETLSYGASFLPNGEKKYSVIRWGWNGLNRTDDIDTGQLTYMSGMICDPPYMVPVKKAKTWIDFAEGIPSYEANTDSHHVSDGVRESSTGVQYVKPIGIYGFDDQLVMPWMIHSSTGDSYRVLVDKFHHIRNDTEYSTYRGILDHDSNISSETPRTVVQFNVVTDSTPGSEGLSGNIANYTYDKKFLMYPDCMSYPYDYISAFTDATLFNTTTNPIPQINYAAVFQSRVFGSSANAITASAFNSYVDYTLDDANGTSPDHAWWSMAQSNTEASGDVTAICTYNNHVVIFRKDFMQLVYNNKNPFRIVDVGKFGCDNNKAWTILNDVLYFASQEKVYAFTGGTPKEISKKLEIDDLSGVVLGSYRDTVWMQTKDSVYIYRDGVWSEIGYFWNNNQYGKIIQFATLDYGLVALVDYSQDNVVTPHHYALVYLDWNVDALGFEPSNPGWWEPEYTTTWWFATDLMMLGKLDVRRVKKMSLLCEGKTGSSVKIYLLPDNARQELDYDDYLVGSISFDKNEKKMLRVLTRQFSGTRHMLYITGKGYVKIYAAELKISWGGDLYVEG